MVLVVNAMAFCSAENRGCFSLLYFETKKENFYLKLSEQEECFFSDWLW